MADLHDKLIEKLNAIAAQFDDLDAQLADPNVASNPDRLRTLSVKRAALADIVEPYRQYQAIQHDIDEHRTIVDAGDDADLVELAEMELPELEERADALLEQISNDLVTADDRAVGSVMLELRAGTGGAEAALWAGDLLAMYQKYAASKKWKVELLDASEGDQGGIRHMVANVRGPGVWQGLGYEGGVHCVKRVPETETQGRIHTSTATVAVLPEPEQVQINIPDEDVEIHVTTAQGPGGQNVNKVATAVHMVHKPTGIEVRMQESKSQHQNREKAWALLRTRVYDRMQQEKDAERAEERAAMIGSGGRSERCRTYRYKESIAVDHRLGKSYALQKLLDGDLDELVSDLIAHDRAQRLAAL